MNKAELVEAVQKTLGKETSKAQAERSVEAVVDGIKGGLRKGKAVQLVGFGTFKVRERRARRARNPRSGSEVMVPAKLVPVFKPSKELKAMVLTEIEIEPTPAPAPVAG